MRDRRYSKSPRHYYVYMLASRRNGTLYVGVTSDLARRVYEHKSDAFDGFTKRYGVHDLVYYETTDDIHAAIAREKQLKKWKRKWKLKLIEKENPTWGDLYADLLSACACPGDMVNVKGMRGKPRLDRS